MMNVDSSESARLIKRRTLAWAMALVIAGSFSTSKAWAGSPKVLQFTASAENTEDNVLTLDSPALNKKPSLKLIVTQYWTGVYNPQPIGVSYSGGKWNIFNESGAAIPAGANFNVLIGSNSVNATPLNSADEFTAISLGKKNPNAVIFSTHYGNPYPNVGLVFVKNYQGIWYDVGLKQWAIFNEDLSDPLAAAYNLADLTANKNAFLLTTTVSNTVSGNAFIDNSVADNNPNAVIFAEPVFSGAVWNHPIGVYYSQDYGQWLIINEDSDRMPAGLQFNVAVYSGTNP
jgi:hypothetical protein